MVNSTKMNTRSSHGKAKVASTATETVTNSVTSPVVNVPTTSPGDVEVIEPVAGSSQVHLSPNANHTKVRDASMVCMQQSCATVTIYT